MRLTITCCLAALLLATPATAPSAKAETGASLGIAAIVNDDIISSLDVEDRLRIAIGNTGLSDTPDVREKLRPQILRQLIDEKLRTQQANARGITVSQKDVDDAVANIEKQNRRPPGSFEVFLREKNMPVRSFFEQIKSQIAWSKLVMKELRPRVSVSEEEIAQKKPKVETGSSSKRRSLMITPLLLPVDKPANEESVRKLADKLVKEIRAGAKFDAVAAQFAGGASAGQAPEPFWVESDQIDPLLSRGLATVKEGEISEPIRTQSGYQIIRILEEKASSAAAASSDDDVDAEFAMKQIILKLKPDANNKEANLLLTIAKSVKAHPGTCTDKGAAGFTDAEAEAADIEVSFVRLPISEMPAPVASMVRALKVGETSEPFATPEGLHLLMLCEKIELPKSFVDHEKVRTQLLQEKLELEAMKYMRNLRREAFIDIK